MTESEKLEFIFETGKRIRFYMDNMVYNQADSPECCLAELSNLQKKVAMQVHVSEPVNLSTLAESLGVSNPSASVTIDRLVEKKVIARTTDPDDRRRIQLTIHPDAREQLDEMHNRFHQAFQKIASKLEHETIERWFQVAEKISDVLKKEQYKP